MSEIIKFYKDQSNDSGYTFSQVLSWPDSKLESVHDYIQWLCPLPEPSRFNPDAPLLSDKDISISRSDPSMKTRIEMAEMRMRAFFCLGKPKEFWKRHNTGEFWGERDNHNLLRVTRIIRFLNLVHSRAMAQAFLADAKRSCDGIDNIGRSLEFWEAAAK
jgi:hypothetical protein